MSIQMSLQVFLSRQYDSACRVGMHFGPLKFIVLLKDWIGSKPNSIHSGEQLV